MTLFFLHLNNNKWHFFFFTWTTIRHIIHYYHGTNDSKIFYMQSIFSITPLYFLVKYFPIALISGYTLAVMARYMILIVEEKVSRSAIRKAFKSGIFHLLLACHQHSTSLNKKLIKALSYSSEELKMAYCFDVILTSSFPFFIYSNFVEK